MGMITLCSLTDNEMGVVKQWHAHEHEAWTAIFGTDRNTILSGGGRVKKGGAVYCYFT